MKITPPQPRQRTPRLLGGSASAAAGQRRRVPRTGALVARLLDGDAGMCRACRAYLRQMKTMIRTVGQLAPDAVPEVPEELLLRFRNWKREAAPHGEL
jgi:hypothetical protein